MLWRHFIHMINIYNPLTEDYAKKRGWVSSNHLKTLRARTDFLEKRECCLKAAESNLVWLSSLSFRCPPNLDCQSLQSPEPIPLNKTIPINHHIYLLPIYLPSNLPICYYYCFLQNTDWYVFLLHDSRR